MNKLLTNWGEELNTEHPLPEYPRPQMVRNSFINLNGPWEYAFCDNYLPPKKYSGTIIVPFSPESLLSGVGRQLKSDETLWYRKVFTLPEDFAIPQGHILLHFGAVDQMADIFVNGKFLCHHEGGYWPFTIDVTKALLKSRNVIVVRVIDSLVDNPFAYGKQRYQRGGIWYTATSGIWQTVWLEAVPKTYIEDIVITPDYDIDKVHIKVRTNGKAAIHAKVTYMESLVGEADGDENNCMDIPISVVHPWTPETPSLYDIFITAGDDSIKSYFAMRKFGTTMYKGFRVLALNNRPYFHNGLLDQGYWSDGMYTAPSDEAMVYDIFTAKRLGYNMLRKHIKIEPLRWYYHCDRMGMLVWQDMVNGGSLPNAMTTAVLPFVGKTLKDNDYRTFGRTSNYGRNVYEKNVEETVSLLYNSPCVAMWTPFNEGWGQFDSLRITEKIRALDPSRTIDHASGWHDQGGGDIDSHHIYFRPIHLSNDKKRVLALTEFGGYSLSCPGHTFSIKTFGYKLFHKPQRLEKAFIKLYEKEVLPLIESQGLSAAVYTQVSDVEDECNGILTFDRKLVKLTPNIAPTLQRLQFSDPEELKS